MRIAMISPLEMRVPPVGYGGTEMIVSLLTEELVRRGHDITLFASGDSVTAARLVPGSDIYLRGSDRNKAILGMLNMLSCLEQADSFDIIHNHTTFEGLATAGLTKTPVLTTLHGGITDDWSLLFSRYRGWFNAISQSALSLLPPKDLCVGVIYNAVECDTYPFNPGPREDFLLYLSRISHEKGTHLAIEVSRLTGMKLKIAGNVDDVDEEYFADKILPQVDGSQVEYVGEAGYELKRDLLSRASCLLAPVTWNEPFGLFMAEAMACGTPVIGLRRGSVPEVIDHGVTGFVVETVPEMAAAVSRIHEIDPYACRRWSQERFDVPRMANDYLAAYERVLDGSRSRQRSAEHTVTGLIAATGGGEISVGM